MAKKPETVFKERILPQLKALPNTYVLKTQEVSKRGVPDVLMCVKGVFVALELKKDLKSNPDDLQRWIMVQIAEAGGITMVVYPENWKLTYRIIHDLAHFGIEKTDLELH